MARSVVEVSRVPLVPVSGGAIAILLARLRDVYYATMAVLVARIAELLRLIPVWHRLTLAMQTQQQTQWCWAAVSTSVAGFYNASTTWTQCTVVNAELGQTTCCANGSTAQCNKPWYLDQALDRVGHFDSWSGVMSFANVRSEIDAGRPLGVRIGWSGGGGHFVVIEGYRDDSNQQVAVDDPWFGASDLTYATLSTSYQATGTWTHSYETQP